MILPAQILLSLAICFSQTDFNFPFKSSIISNRVAESLTFSVETASVALREENVIRLNAVVSTPRRIGFSTDASP